ncbi:MAG TPA: SH3 domain-containing protein, partial [Anaerolineales bacterium]|nr:SH3 domain-containing protein [Anaerolineales bacterium]
MKQNWFPANILLLYIALVSIWTFSESAPINVLARQSTETPSIDSPSTGVFITVITDEPQINVRMGPSSSVYPIVGILPRGATAPALGRSQGGDWVQIEYAGAPNNTGWVYSPLIQLSPGTLRIVEPPPTPVPPATSTIDPTLAAQFVIVPTNTRPPTFTPPPSMTYFVYTQYPPDASQNSVPVAAIIVALV